MSDLISTPSQTQSAVSNEAFEALIDLLASDGVDEISSTRPGDHPRTQPNATLRDSSGKLDYDRIRSMFAAQKEGRRISTAPGPLGGEKIRVQSPIALNEDGDSDDEPRSHRSTSSATPSRPSSMSPEPGKYPPTGHRRSSTFGNELSVAIHENVMTAKDDVALTLLRQPLSFDELNTALADAYEEVANLRQRYDELETFVSKRLEAKTRDQAEFIPGALKTAPGTYGGRAEARNADSRAQPKIVVPLSSDVPAEITSLSENEAKIALSAFAHSLNLSLSAIDSMASAAYLPPPPPQGLAPPNPARQHDVASITRALKFLSVVDELVWRRASGTSGPRTLLPVFSEENYVALVARLELWERAVRRPSRV